MILISVSISIFTISDKKISRIINFIKKSKIKKSEFKTCERRIYELMSFITIEDVCENPTLSKTVLNKLLHQIFYLTRNNDVFTFDTQ
jgi:hypothetical protein